MIALGIALQRQFEGFALHIDEDLALDGITALFGPSGSGKTTLLRVLAGLDAGALGRLAFASEVWQDDKRGIFVPPHRRGVGYVFQDTRLFQHLSVEGNLRFADRRGYAADPRIGFGDVIDALDLAPLLERRTQALSGGERQRVAIGRTLLARPRLLLMDEPLAALDIRRKAEILPYIIRLPAAFGVPILYVTHAIDEVGQVAGRMVVLSQGRVAATGTVAEVFERLDLQPLTGRFEASVVLAARVVGHDPHFALTRLDVAGQGIVVPALDLDVGSEARLRVRARDVALATRPPTGISIRNVLEGVVAEIAEEPETAFAEVLIDLGGAQLRARVTRHAVAELGLKAGSPAYALVKSVAIDRRLVAPAS